MHARKVVKFAQVSCRGGGGKISKLGPPAPRYRPHCFCARGAAAALTALTSANDTPNAATPWLQHAVRPPRAAAGRAAAALEASGDPTTSLAWAPVARALEAEAAS